MTTSLLESRRDELAAIEDLGIGDMVQARGVLGGPFRVVGYVTCPPVEDLVHMEAAGKCLVRLFTKSGLRAFLKMPADTEMGAFRGFDESLRSPRS